MRTTALLIAMLLATTAATAKQLEPGNIDLQARHVLRNADGTISTVCTVIVEFDGVYVLLPLATPRGIVTVERAAQEYISTGLHMGVYDELGGAEREAERIHTEQEEIYR